VSEKHEDAHEMPEGVEAAPPGTRIMAVARWLLVIVMASLAVTSVVHFVGRAKHAKSEAEKAIYHCPMHPGVVSDHPGDCPICGMTLVLRDTKAASTSSQTAMPSASTAALYACPMHPDQTSNDPHAKCAICGMNMEPRKPPPSSSSSGSTTVSSAVPGLVPIELTPDRIQLIGLKTAKATKEKLGASLSVVGFVTAQEQGIAKVHARTTGWIDDLLVAKTGDKVVRGQALASVYSPEILLAQQEFLKARTWSTDAGPLAGLENDAKKRLELVGMSSWEIGQVEKTGIARRNVAISSPIAGYVTKKSAFKGLYFQPGTELFEIADLSTVWLLADVPERDLARVKLEQKAHLKLLAYPNETFDGAVKFLYPSINPSTRTLRARVVLPNKEGRLFPGMYGDVNIEVPGGEAIVVPSSAIVDTGDVQYVFLAREGGRFEPRRVKLGARTSEKTQVLEGLIEGDVVVTTGNFLIDSESRLHVAVEAAATGTPVNPHAGH